jgi:hypothetical protein
MFWETLHIFYMKLKRPWWISRELLTNVAMLFVYVIGQTLERITPQLWSDMSHHTVRNFLVTIFCIQPVIPLPRLLSSKPQLCRSLGRGSRYQLSIELLYHFIQFACHASHPISENPCNNFFSILADFGDFSEKLKSYVIRELNEMVQ